MHAHVPQTGSTGSSHGRDGKSSAWPPIGLYTYIQSNKRRSIALLIGLFVLVYVMVFAGALLAEALTVNAPLDYLIRAAEFDFIKALPFATGGAILWIVIAYFFHQSMIDAVTGASEVTRGQEPRLYNLLENLCISRGITMPTLRVAEDDALNAFSTGLNEKQYSITVMRGLMNALNDAEMEVGARPRTDPHPQRRRADDGDRGGDRRRDLVLRRIGFPPVLPGELLRRRLPAARRRRSPTGGGAGIVIVIALALIVVSWILSVVIRFALSRAARISRRCRLRRTHEKSRRHDLGAAQDRRARRITHATSAVMEMCIDNPREGFADIFDTHPSVEDRVARAHQIRRRPRSGAAGA